MLPSGKDALRRKAEIERFKHKRMRLLTRAVRKASKQLDRDYRKGLPIEPVEIDWFESDATYDDESVHDLSVDDYGRFMPGPNEREMAELVQLYPDLRFRVDKESRGAHHSLYVSPA